MVSFERIPACRGCGACGRDIKPEVISARGKANIGDVVKVERVARHSAKFSLLTYPIYAIGFLAGLVISNLVTGGSELEMVLGGTVGLAFSFIVMKLPVFRAAAPGVYPARVISVNDPEAIREINEEGICPKGCRLVHRGKIIAHRNRNYPYCRLLAAH